MSKKKRGAPTVIELSGPKRFQRDDDVHILRIELDSYHASVPLTTAELRLLRQVIDEWLVDE